MATANQNQPTEASLAQLCLTLWHKLTPVRRRQFVFLIILMVMASFAEVISIGLILPFLGLLADPARVFAHPLAQPVIEMLNIKTSEEMLLPVVIAFCIAAIASGGIRLLLMYANIRYSHAVGADLSLEVYRRTLYQPYSVHVARNSSEVIAGILGKIAMLIGSVLVPLLTLLSASILFISIMLALIAIDPLIAVISTVVFGLSYGGILQLTKSQLIQNSEVVSVESPQVVKSLQEGLGGIRDVLIDGTQEIYCRIFQKADRALRQANANTTIISGSPRYFIETLGMVMIAALAFSMSQREEGMITTLPILGAIALGAQRLLPVLQQGYSSLAIMRGAQVPLRDVIALLEQPVPTCSEDEALHPISFEREIALNDVRFRYSPETADVLKSINLVVKKGSRVGFIGATGSGKSTLLDIIMGLLNPVSGTMQVDGVAIDDKNRRAWQKRIAHVPQHIFLSDSTIKENIAFGVPYELIDDERVGTATARAQLDGVIADLPEKFDTRIGERGVRLSGGQRQRIGIARALYRNADVIIFDEATSALDSDTERAVTDAIDALGDHLTLLIIAHREKTLQNCDTIFELKDGKISRQITYADLTLNQ